MRIRDNLRFYGGYGGISENSYIYQWFRVAPIETPQLSPHRKKSVCMGEFALARRCDYLVKL